MKKNVIVGMSGGVDSTVSAILLQQAGFNVSGVFMKIWNEKYANVYTSNTSCYRPQEREIQDVKNICRDMGIPFYVIDAKNEFEKRVLNYFKKDYLCGRTPNPCVVCNRFIKFQYIIEQIEKKGVNFDFFATGHYARVEYDDKRKRYILKKGIDSNKDQSYFLFLLTQKQLSRVIFPLGNYTKQTVKDIAKQHGFDVYQKKESQDFMKGSRFFIFEEGIKSGDIIDIHGNILGKHNGIIHYTIGQRKGTGIAKGKPVYVIGIDAEKNTIIVGDEKNLYKNRLIATDINLIGLEKINGSMNITAKIRYKHNPAKATLSLFGKKEIELIFEHSQRAISPGQAVVFYKNDEVVGGGFIKTAL